MHKDQVIYNYHEGHEDHKEKRADFSARPSYSS